MDNPRLIVSEKERDLMRSWIIGHNPPDVLVRDSLDRLYQELEKADVRPESALPADVVRINSIVDIRTPTGRKEGLQLVMPAEADLKQNKLSVLSVMGSALIGYQAGATITWHLPKGVEHIVLERVENRSGEQVAAPLGGRRS